MQKLSSNRYIICSHNFVQYRKCIKLRYEFLGWFLEVSKSIFWSWLYQIFARLLLGFQPILIWKSSHVLSRMIGKLSAALKRVGTLHSLLQWSEDTRYVKWWRACTVVYQELGWDIGNSDIPLFGSIWNAVYAIFYKWEEMFIRLD